MSRAQEIAKVVRRRLVAIAKKHPEAAVALSGGVDSRTVLCSLLVSGAKPTVVSYTPASHESTDFRMARQTAKEQGLRFVPALASVATPDLERAARYVISKGFRTKLEVECLTPMVSVLREARAAGIEVLFTGDQADGFFMNNNWMSRNFDRARGIPGPQRQHIKLDEDAWRIDELRRIYWEEDRSCSGALVSLGESIGVEVVVPYRDPAIRKAFSGTHWLEINEPRLKEPLHLTFPYMLEEMGVRPAPVNLHRGDSRWAQIMRDTLMSQPHLMGPWRTTTGLYAAMARGDV